MGANLQDKRILVVGGGIGGLTAALSLAREGAQVDVFEQAMEFAEVGAGIQLSPNCTKVLQALGLADELEAAGFKPLATQFRHWRTGKVIHESPLGEAVCTKYGAPYYHIHRGDLLRMLLTAVQKHPSIKLHAGSRVETVSHGKEVSFGKDVSFGKEGALGEATVSVQIDGAVFDGDLLIGADGIHSAVRDALWGTQPARFTGNVAWRALVPVERLPEGLIRPMSTVWWGPQRHFVHYFVKGGRMVNCVCVVEKSGWEIESWTQSGEHSELKQDFAGWHPSIQTLIDAADAASLFKWALYDRDPMPQWGQGCVTLLGDACHPTLPFMAQGAAMAIEDAAVLTNCLKSEADIPSSLQYYESLRKARTAFVQLGSRRNARVFHMSGPMTWFRNRAARLAGNRISNELYGYDALVQARQLQASTTN